MSGSTPSFSLEEARIRDIQAELLSHRLSCRELVAAYLERIERYDRAGPRLNSIVSTNDSALSCAAGLDDGLRESGKLSGPLHGIPVLVKDQFDTDDMPTCYGSQVFEGHRPPSNAAAVKRLRDAGAVILAKTSMPDLATAYFSFSSRSGTTKNPYRLDRDAAGSSSGTGAGIAANLGAVGLGEDTGGSVRVPAAYNGLVGLRPTTGLVSRAGMLPVIRLDDTPGPMTRTVEDAVRVFEVLTGYDPADPSTAVCAMASPALSEGSARQGIGVKIGVVRELFGADRSARPVNEVIGTQLAVLQRAGATLVDPVGIEGLQERLTETSLAEICARSDIDSFLSNLPRGFRTTLSEIYAEHRYHPQLDLFDVIVRGPADYRSDVRFLQRFANRESLRNAVLGVMARHDLDALAYPTVQITLPSYEEIAAGKWTTMTFPVNSILAAHGTFPAISFPAGFATDGSPVGLELLGRPYHDRSLLKLALELEAVGFRRRPCPL